LKVKEVVVGQTRYIVVPEKAPTSVAAGLASWGASGVAVSREEAIAGDEPTED